MEQKNIQNQREIRMEQFRYHVRKAITSNALKQKRLSINNFQNVDKKEILIIIQDYNKNFEIKEESIQKWINLSNFIFSDQLDDEIEQELIILLEPTKLQQMAQIIIDQKFDKNLVNAILRILLFAYQNDIFPKEDIQSKLIRTFSKIDLQANDLDKEIYINYQILLRLMIQANQIFFQEFLDKDILMNFMKQTKYFRFSEKEDNSTQIMFLQNICELFYEITDIYKTNQDPKTNDLYRNRISMYVKYIVLIPAINENYLNLVKIKSLINLIEQDFDLIPYIENCNLIGYCQNILDQQTSESGHVSQELKRQTYYFLKYILEYADFSEKIIKIYESLISNLKSEINDSNIIEIIQCFKTLFESSKNEFRLILLSNKKFYQNFVTLFLKNDKREISKQISLFLKNLETFINPQDDLSKIYLENVQYWRLDTEIEKANLIN